MFTFSITTPLYEIEGLKLPIPFSFTKSCNETSLKPINQFGGSTRSKELLDNGFIESKTCFLLSQEYINPKIKRHKSALTNFIPLFLNCF